MQDTARRVYVTPFRVMPSLAVDPMPLSVAGVEADRVGTVKAEHLAVSFDTCGGRRWKRQHTATARSECIAGALGRSKTVKGEP